MAREWEYWTRNKLAILADYLPAFNTASAKSSHRVYLDLMAGEPVNIAKGTSETFDGSARVAMSAKPGFTRLAFCERDAEKARQLRLDLDQRFPNDSRWQVFEGDCNDVVEDMLASVAKLAWAPVFVFIDQQAAEVSWETIQKVSTFRSGNRKSELWILMSPAMVAKGAKGTNAAGFVERVDKLYGTDDWQRIQHARDSRSLGADGFRAEMVNLFRWRLEQSLGYAMTARIPMKMTNGTSIYDMVFATDHPVGGKIMNDLYRKAANREPGMVAEARARAMNRRSKALAPQGFSMSPPPSSRAKPARSGHRSRRGTRPHSHGGTGTRHSQPEATAAAGISLHT